jgi:hypothetical protein
VQHRCPEFPLDTNKDPCCHAQPASITLSPVEAALTISTYLLPPPPPGHKKSCKQQLKMKFDIALRQNCDQSATVWWSTQSSARHWRVREGCLTWNNSGDNNKRANLNKRHPPSIVGSVGKRTTFCNRAYRITNVRLDWRVHDAGVGQRGVHMTTAHSCRMLRHGTMD